MHEGEKSLSLLGEGFREGGMCKYENALFTP
jgi:hypothetical protein